VTQGPDQDPTPLPALTLPWPGSDVLELTGSSLPAVSASSLSACEPHAGWVTL
jgi:hypothetical protein